MAVRFDANADYLRLASGIFDYNAGGAGNERLVFWDRVLSPSRHRPPVCETALQCVRFVSEGFFVHCGSLCEWWKVRNILIDTIFFER